MTLSFFGAAQTVTGSKHLLTLNDGTTILFDCGLFQGMGKQTPILNENFGFNASEVDIVILSHAHIDHSGLLPKLVKEGFSGVIYCTPATKDLATILLEDSAVIQRDDAKFVNKKRAKQGLPLVQPLYSIEDAHAATALMQPIQYQTPTQILPHVQLMFTDAGHIIGSAAVHVTITEHGKTQQVTFSGDVGRYRDIILKSPDTFSQADFIIIESTYGNSLHEAGANTVDGLEKWIQHTCIGKKGKLIIPAFSVGRTQELLYALNQLELENRLPSIPIYVDSPLSKEATDVIKSYPSYFNKRIQKILEIDDDPFHFKGLHFVESADESKSLNAMQQPMVIISASGMADAGRIKHHILNNIHNPNNTILLVGYAEPMSLGGRLQRGEKEVKIFGEWYTVKAEVGSMRSMSAHGDYEDLSQFLACQNTNLVQKVFVVHGEQDVQEEFAQRLRKKGFKQVFVPAMHQQFEL